MLFRSYLFAVLALTGQLFTKVWITEESSPWGVYSVRFFKDGRWVQVIVDDRFPCDASGAPCFGHSKQENEFWICVLEKAYAKIHASCPCPAVWPCFLLSSEDELELDARDGRCCAVLCRGPPRFQWAHSTLNTRRVADSRSEMIYFYVILFFIYFFFRPSTKRETVEGIFSRTRVAQRRKFLKIHLLFCPFKKKNK